MRQTTSSATPSSTTYPPGTCRRAISSGISARVWTASRVLVTADEIAYPPALEITSRVNGELRQKSNTALLITSIGQILEELTGGMTLLPGTIIATGTPAGVGMGFDPPRFLQSGDTVECAIEGIGTLCSTVI